MELLREQNQRASNTAYAHLYEHAYTKIQSMVTRNNGLEEDAKDIFQEALIILTKAIRKKAFNFTASVQTYVYAVARNLWLKELKRRKSEVSFDGRDLPDSIIDDDTNELEKQTILLRNSINELSEDCRKILIDFYYAKLSMSEIKNEFKLSSEQAAKNKKYRCLKNLIEICKRNM